MENFKNIPAYKSDEVADAIYATADKIHELVNELCKTLAYSDISNYSEVELALQVCENSFPKQAYNRLNSIFSRREKVLERLSSFVERERERERERELANS